MIPPGALHEDGIRRVGPDLMARVMLAVLERYPRQGYGLTIREVAEDVGCAVSSAHVALRHLRDRGLVGFDAARSIHPTVAVVATFG